jgi:Protein of unknown function (DUF664)
MMAGMSIDMFIEPEKDPRTEPPTRGGERGTLAGFLRWHRETLELKCSGLDAAALAARSVGPSSMSLLGLLRQMSLRWVLIHMIEEYARHNGHADLLRERIDGAVGQ